MSSMHENECTPRVAVIIPTYNHREYVVDSVNSVFAQTLSDFEVIVVNDGSPDDTATVLRHWIGDKRFRYIEQSNRGQAAARNRGLAEAKGEFIAFLDDDDVWPAARLRAQIDILEKTPSAVLAYGAVADLQSGVSVMHRSWSGQVLSRLLKGNWIISPGQTLIRRSALRKIGPLDETLRGADDWDMYVRLAQHGEFVYDDTVALLYRKHAANASNDFAAMFRQCEMVLGKHRKLMSAEEYRSGIRRYRDYYSSLLIGRSFDEMLQGAFGRALRSVHQASQLNVKTLCGAIVSEAARRLKSKAKSNRLVRRVCGKPIEAPSVRQSAAT